MWWAAACRASSLLLHRDSGAPASAGPEHASALTCATTTGPNTGGRPLRGRSVRPARPCSAKRVRHLRAVSVQIPNLRAIIAFEVPTEAASTIRARITSRPEAL